MSRETRGYLLLTTLALVAAIAGGLTTHGPGVEGAQAVARYLARVSLALFLAAFTAPAWPELMPGRRSESLAAAYPALLISFAYAHLVHLGAVVIFLRLSGEVPEPVVLSGGGLAYAALLVAAVTSGQSWVKRLGERSWRRLQSACLFYVWLIFFLTYLPRVMGEVPQAGGSQREFIPLLVLLVVSLLVRGAATLPARSPDR